MFYKDLSQYFYENLIIIGVFRIGWLQSNNTFKKGHADNKFINKLKLILTKEKFIAVKTKGFHLCDICQNNVQKKLKRSSSELWIPGINNIANENVEIFSFPEMIIHFMETHSYLPPMPFITSVMSLDLSIEWNSHKTSETFINTAIEKDEGF